MTIKVRNLSKAFAEVRAVDDLSFDVRRGELFGLLGPNGAGKTTTINLLTGLARPNRGTITIEGINCAHNFKPTQRLIGVVPDESNLYPELSGFENLRFCASLYGLRKAKRTARAQELIETFGLSDAAHRKFDGYSRGMKRKLTIAAGIIHQPPILFLDEPTTGIDVASARTIRALIADLNRRGTTILLTTHYIEEAERLCSRIAFMVAGRIVRADTVEDLMQPLHGRHVALLTLSEPATALGENMLRAFPEHRFDTQMPGQIRVESDRLFPVGPIVRFLEEAGIEVVEARRVRPSLEDVFVEITGIEADTMRREKEKARART